MYYRLVKGTKNYKMIVRNMWRAFTIWDTIMQLLMQERSHEWLYERSVVKAMLLVHALIQRL
jgi:hypothetical protein